MGKRYYSKKMLLGSIATGALYSGIGEMIYSYLNNMLPRFIVTMLFFVGFFLFEGAIFYIITSGARKARSFKFNTKRWLVALLVMMCAAAVFELIYDIEIHKKNQDITSYIFVIDNSGSMDSQDPHGVRYDVIKELLSEKNDDFEYALYTFSDEAVLQRTMQPKSVYYEINNIKNDGGTAINGTLKKVYSDIENGILICREGCRMIFLSDGCSTDYSGLGYSRYKTVLNQYQQKGISIGAVGIGNADTRLMQLLADRTGGVYVHIDSVDSLQNAMEKASTEIADKRNLLGIRQYGNLNWIFACMRIVFISILGLIIGIEKVLICDVYIDTHSVIKSSICGSILAGIFLEVSIEVLLWPLWLCHMIICILMAFTLLHDNLKIQVSNLTTGNVRKSF